MGYFSKDVMRVHLPTAPDEWVEIPAHGRLADMEFIRKQTRGADDEDIEATYAALKRNVVAWSLRDEMDRPVEISREAFSNLRAKDLQAISEAIAKRDGIPTRTADAKNS